MPPIPPEVTWNPQFLTNTGKPKLPPKYYSISYNGHALMFTVDELGTGDQPVNGCPLWICLHGGGTTRPNNDNDDNWTKTREYLYYPVAKEYAQRKGRVILVCPRGISTTDRTDTTDAKDDWDLHFRPESYLLFEQMISKLVQPSEAPGISSPRFADPDRVYLWGFSAGGDGAFHLASMIPDRFAAVVAAAGHPSGANFNNYANTYMLMQVGERDVYYNGDGVPNSRAKAYLEQAQKPLTAKFVEYGSGDLYRHDCMVVSTETSSGSDPYFYHNSWSSKHTLLKGHTVLLSDKITVDNWLAQPDMNGTLYDQWVHTKAAERVFSPSPPSAWYKTNFNIHPMDAVDKNVRYQVPGRLIWDLQSRPSQPDPRKGYPAPVGWEKRMFYWLFVRNTAASRSDTAKAAQPEDVSFLGSSDANTASTLRIQHPNEYMGYLLQERFITGSRKIVVTIKTGMGANDWTEIYNGRVAVQESIKAETKALSGDPNMQFAAMLYLNKTSDNPGWSVAAATKLDN